MVWDDGTEEEGTGRGALQDGAAVGGCELKVLKNFERWMVVKVKRGKVEKLRKFNLQKVKSVSISAIKQNFATGTGN